MLVLTGCAGPASDPLGPVAIAVTGVATDLTFTYRAIAPDRYGDQLVTIGNPGAVALAPTLEFVALDGAGAAMPDVVVETAFGTSRGAVVVPPASSVIEYLRFPDGPDLPVAAVAVRVRAVDELPGVTVGALPRFDRIDDGRAYRLTNNADAPVTVRVVILGFNRKGVGGASQVAHAYRVADRVTIGARRQQTVPIKKGFRGPMAAYPSAIFVR